MAIAEKASSRLPRGTKPVVQAFLTALDSVPEASQPAVAKAAQAMIKDELKLRRSKQRSTATGKTPARRTTRKAATAPEM
jgi:hypothetical protein